MDSSTETLLQEIVGIEILDSSAISLYADLAWLSSYGISDILRLMCPEGT
jgi:hypothetical protein